MVFNLFKLPAVFCAGNDQRKIEQEFSCLPGTKELRHRQSVVPNLRRWQFFNAGFADQTGLFLVRRHRSELPDPARFHVLQADQAQNPAAWVRSRENSANKEDHADAAAAIFLARAGKFFPDRREPQPLLMQNLSSKAAFSPKQSEKKVLSSNVFMGKSFRFLCGVCQYALTSLEEDPQKWNFFPDRGVPFDLLADRLYRSMRTQEAVRQGFVFAQQSQ